MGRPSLAFAAVAWGANTYGQTNVPAGLTNVVAIAAGGAHALALRENGTVVAWGANASGQTNVPANLSNVISVAAGSDHSIARRNDGTAVAWGDNTYGQTNIPVGLTNAQFVAAGAHHSMAAIDSRFLEYPVNVSRDLLLICNTNVESRFVLPDQSTNGQQRKHFGDWLSSSRNDMPHQFRFHECFSHARAQLADE